MTSLGCVADDFTGGTDVAAALRRAGLSVALLFDPPAADTRVPETDAVVIALKTRTVPVRDAVAQSRASVAWLRSHGARLTYFKYCSTFDSTPVGNIGPVNDALLESLDEPMTLVCPATPEHGRTTYLGHLFVGGDLLSDSPMRHHPLTPMTDAKIDRWLALQTTGQVARLELSTIRAGTTAVRVHLEALRTGGTRHVVVDAVSDDDLDTVAAVSTGFGLVTGGAGLAGALGRVLARESLPARAPQAALPSGPAVVLAGSCSAATLEQVTNAAAAMPSYRLDPVDTPDPADMLDGALAWLDHQQDAAAVLIYSSAGPEERGRATRAMGPNTAAHLERTLGAVARAAVDRGANRVVVAGGETSGAVVQALGVGAVVVGEEADRGVPWVLTTDGDPLALLLKSGNFGGPDLLVRAAGALP